MFIVSNLRKYEVKLFSGLCFPEQRKLDGEEKSFIKQSRILPSKVPGTLR